MLAPSKPNFYIQDGRSGDGNTRPELQKRRKQNYLHISM